MKIFFLIEIFVLQVIGYNYIYEQSVGIIILYNIFLAVCVTAQLAVKSWGIKRNFICLYALINWTVYNSLGFAHAAIIEREEGPLKYDVEIYLLLIISTILLFFGMRAAKQTPHKGFRAFTNYEIKPEVIVILISASLLIDLYKIHLAGGLWSYLYLPYGAKAESSMLTFFNLFGIMLNNTTILALPFICFDCRKPIKALCIAFYAYKMAFGAISGSSASLFSPVMSFFFYAYFLLEKRSSLDKLKRYFTLAIVIGVVGGIFIRTNRKSYESSDISSFDLSSSFDEVMASRTYDNIVNLNSVLVYFEPTYTPGQFIYPYIHYLPRGIFPWKPMELGRIVGYTFVGVGEDSMAGFVTTPMGEFYYDFGFLGIVLGMLFSGYILSYIQQNLNASRGNPFHIWAVVIAISATSGALPAWYTGCFSRITSLFIIVFFSILLNKFFSNRRKYVN